MAEFDAATQSKGSPKLLSNSVTDRMVEAAWTAYVEARDGRPMHAAIDAALREQALSQQQVGCEGDDGLLRIHSESETCDVCAPVKASPEPVAWLDEEIDCAYTPTELDGGGADELLPLYTHPPQPDDECCTRATCRIGQRVPLTDNEINRLASEMVKRDKSVNWLARAIELAHGIGGEV